MVCETSYKRKFVKSISVIPVKNGQEVWGIRTSCAIISGAIINLIPDLVGRDPRKEAQ